MHDAIAGVREPRSSTWVYTCGFPGRSHSNDIGLSLSLSLSRSLVGWDVAGMQRCTAGGATIVVLVRPDNNIGDSLVA